MKQPLYKAEMINGKWYAVNLQNNQVYDLSVARTFGTNIYSLKIDNENFAIMKILSSGEKQFYFPFKDDNGNIYSICEFIETKDYFNVSIKHKKGVADYDYNILVEPKYDHLAPIMKADFNNYINDIMWGMIGEERYLINVKNKKVFGPYKSIKVFYPSDSWQVHFVIGEKSVNGNGESKYEIISLSSWKKLHRGLADSYHISKNDNILMFKQNNVWSGWFINKESDVHVFRGFSKKLKHRYDEPLKFTDGFIIAKLNGKYGVEDMNEHPIIQFEYDKIYDYIEMKESNCYLTDNGLLEKSWMSEERTLGRDDPYDRDFFLPNVETKLNTRIIEDNKFKVKQKKLLGRWLCVIKE